jgi:hypothetical protein
VQSFEAEAPSETLVFVRDESVIEIHAMRDKYPAIHELHCESPQEMQTSTRRIGIS